MKTSFRHIRPLFFLIFYGFLPGLSSAQMITGIWKGKINRQKVEVRIIQKGDSLAGTSYYYESVNNYRRYTIKGYFDEATNAAVWWDDQLVAEKSGKLSLITPGKQPMLSRADFNCPGSGRMMLDGKAARRDDEMKPSGDVHLDKTDRGQFEDEWDFVIDNYTVGANDPDIIDSVAAIAYHPPAPVEAVDPEPKPEPVVVINKPPPTRPTTKPAPPVEKPAPVVKAPEPDVQPTIVEKFTSRQKVFIKEIPVKGDSIELRFYDNAEIDGDSISLFLDDRLIFEHIRLAANAYIIKLPVSDLKETSELVMVAENMGLIPPNTSYMVAMIDGKKYDAYLASTEGSSALIRLVKGK